MLLDAFDTIQDNWSDWAILFGVIFGAYLAVVWLASTYWTYKDIGARTRDPVVQVLMVVLVLVFFLPGLLLYLIIRPKLTLAERYDRNLEAEALLRELQEDPSCPFCRRKIGPDFLVCPYCRTTLGVACERCERVLSFSWVVCPYCGRERSQPELAAPQSVTVVPAPQPALPEQAASPSEDQTVPTPAVRQRRAPTARYTPSATSGDGASGAAPQPASPASDPAMDAGT
jgi:RNA polymerase subunit RPABC4/transcription elongation factor Spt4